MMNERARERLAYALDSVIGLIGCRKSLLKRWGVPGYTPVYNEDGLFTNHNCDFIKDSRFKRAYDAGFGTGSTQGWEIRWRIHTLLWAASVARNLPGDFIECGTYLGTSAMAVVDYVDFNTLGKKFFLCDTFTGLPTHSETSHEYKKNDYYDEVAATFKAYPGVRLVKGLIPDSLHDAGIESLSLINIDCGMQAAEAPALRYLWKYLVKGGVALFSCYGYPGFHHIKEQYDAFARENGVSIYSCPTGQGLLIKP